MRVCRRRGATLRRRGVGQLRLPGGETCRGSGRSLSGHAVVGIPLALRQRVFHYRFTVGSDIGARVVGT